MILTGSSSGIGLSLAKTLISRGLHVVSIGRSPPHLPDDLLNEVTHLEFDLTQNLFLTDLPLWLSANAAQLELVGFVHAAGRGYTIPLLDTTFDSINEQIYVNLVSGIMLSKILLPYLRRSHSRIVFMGSRARRFPFYGGSAYCASKAGLYALSDCLALEVKNLNWNVGVTIFEFGPVSTGFAGLPKASTQISVEGAATLVADLLSKSLTDFDTRVVEIVPTVSRLSNG